MRRQRLSRPVTRAASSRCSASSIARTDATADFVAELPANVVVDARTTHRLGRDRRHDRRRDGAQHRTATCRRSNVSGPVALTTTNGNVGLLGRLRSRDSDSIRVSTTNGDDPRRASGRASRAASICPWSNGDGPERSAAAERPVRGGRRATSAGPDRTRRPARQYADDRTASVSRARRAERRRRSSGLRRWHRPRAGGVLFTIVPPLQRS